jgi:hypothetical protein
MQRGKGEAMAGETEDRVRRLRELRDGGAISDEDYRRMVLDLVDSGEDEAEPKAEGAGETVGIPSPEQTQAAPMQSDHVEEPPAKPASGLEEPAGRPPKPTTTSPATEAPKTSQSTPAPRANKTRIIVAAVVLGLLALTFYGFYSGDIAFKPSDISQKYWDAGRKARTIGKQYLDGNMTADEANLELAEFTFYFSPEDEVGDPDMSDSEELNDENVASAIGDLDNAIEQKGYVDDTGVASSDTAVRDALHDLDKALQGRV